MSVQSGDLVLSGGGLLSHIDIGAPGQPLDHGMTVRERFVQNVRSGAGSYNAVWSMTVKSLRPRS